MKSIIYTSFLLLFTLSLNAQVGVGTTNPEAALDIVSADSGLLIPRVALTSTTVVLPVLTGTESELVYNTAAVADVTPGFYYLSSATGPWVRFGGATGWLTTGNNDVNTTSFLGTTTNFDVVFKRANIAAGRIGFENTFFGNRAGAINSAVKNTYIGAGAGALLNSSASQSNVAVGFNALQSGIGRVNSNSTAIGTQALENPTSNANNNTAIGYQAGINTSGSNNVMIGNGVNVGGAQGSVAIGAGTNSTFANSIAIGAGAATTAVNQIRLGNTVIQEVVTSGIVKAPSFLATGTNTTYADYVFEDYFKGYSKIKNNYKFNTLESAEAFVIKNGHLPGVKSYAEVMENGFKLDLTHATITNLEKLEEQFIYVIELNKKIKEQENTIQVQDEKIKALETRLERIELLLNK